MSAMPYNEGSGAGLKRAPASAKKNAHGPGRQSPINSSGGGGGGASWRAIAGADVAIATAGKTAGTMV